MRSLVARSSRRSLVAGVALVSVTALGLGASAFGLTASEQPFVPKPCQSALYQQTSVFADGQTILNDCAITIHSVADIAARRAQLNRFIWGAAGFPSTKLPVSVDKNVSSPVAGLQNLGRVDTLHIAMDAGEVGIAYHFIPLARKANRLVVLSPGHVCTLDDGAALTDTGYGMRRTINSLLLDGYSVLAVEMPHMNYLLPNNCGQPSHDEMFRTLHPAGSPMKFFLEPVAVSLNYAQTRAVADQFPVYRDFSMTGVSGGGWTTVVYAAIDPRIKLSIPVAGSLPLYLRFPDSAGDTEQNLTSFYTLAGYPDLHVMGSYGPGRRQVQVLNRHDGCCFGEPAHRADLSGMSFDRATRSYEWRVRGAISTLPAGSFRLEIDELAPEHMITWSTIASDLLAELNQDRRTVGAASTAEVFVRGMNGNLWYAGPAGWKDTGLPMVGAPATIGGQGVPFDVFYRDVSNRLMHAVVGTTGWKSFPMGVVITDPVVASTAPRRFDVVALGTDYMPYRWSWNGIKLNKQRLGSTRGLEQPALIAAPGRIDIFFRGFDRAVHHVRTTDVGVIEVLVGGVASDAPTAVATTGPGGTTRRVFMHGPDHLIWGATSYNDGPWTWARLAPAGMADRFAGSPTASTSGGTVIVRARTTTGSLGTLRLAPSTAWTYANVGGAIVDSPSSVGNAAYAQGRDGTLQFFDGTTWYSKGGRFD